MDNGQACLFVIKDDNQIIRLPCLMFLNAFNFFQDSPYPFAGASGETLGNGQLDDSFRSNGATRKGQEP